jgi:hypothetical protein
MQAKLDFLQTSLLVVDFFRTPISLLNTCHIPFRRNCMPFSENCSFGGLSGEAGPGVGPHGDRPDRFGGPPNWYTDCQFDATPK